MRNELDRRTLIRTMGLAAGVAGWAPAATARRLKIGQTSINWGSRPPDAEPGIRDSARLGYWGYEALGVNLESLEAAEGGLGRILDQYKMPLPSTYFNVNIDLDTHTTAVEPATWGQVKELFNH